jgi:hypothetical protein
VFRGDLQHRIDAELIEVRRRPLRALVVGLVDRQQQRLSRRTKLLRDGLIAAHEALSAVDDKHNRVRAVDRALALLDDEFVKRILAGAVQPSGIKELKGGALPADRTRQRITRCTGNGSHDRPAGARDAVKQRGFTDVWASDQHDRWAFTI